MRVGHHIARGCGEAAPKYIKGYMEKTYIFTREVRIWGVEEGDTYNPDLHVIIGGTEKLLADGVIEEEISSNQ